MSSRAVFLRAAAPDASIASSSLSGGVSSASSSLSLTVGAYPTLDLVFFSFPSASRRSLATLSGM
eukprot:CAMPEP_0196171744 /NCGR_PEP_ID=MMETSP0911-20130528/5655_1 /TAXON_ID=49265 /ORGANISM="Thalassiosira rotula, Strain GSO102" /LENGTH=64 /DNA_ID=CAMNT_0041438621 /DNA_START=60 /DNA_END=254 /DNA_ORIENTATION=+